MITEKQKKILVWSGIAVLGYVILRPYLKLSTSSPKEKKMALTCSEGQKLIKSDYDEYRCVPVGGEAPKDLESVQINL